MENYWDKKKDLHLVFMDMEKAYDKLQVKVLSCVLTRKR